jgi:group I intron endonuclease
MAKVLYAHRKQTDGSIFYIGIGTEKRPYSKSSRNEYWHNTVNKYGYYVDVLSKDLSIEDALELEEFVICELGRKDLDNGNLVNLNNGGKGNLQVSDLTKKKMSNSAMGKTAWNKGLPMSEEQKVKLSIIRKGATSPRKGVKLTEETKDKIRKANLGGKSPSAKAVYNTETNETFETIRQAAKSINMSCSTLSSMLNGNSFNKTNLKFKK